MAFRQNDGSRNATADAFGALYNGGSARVLTGTQPAAGGAETGTLLAAITIPTPAFGAAASGVIAKSGTWSTTASTGGVAGYLRVVSADTLKFFDLNITIAGGGGEAIINDINIVQNGNVVITTLAITMPAA